MDAARGDECHAAQVVGADGEMDATAMEGFAAATGLQGRGLSYAVVSILGPQGSGKSTLLNHLFGTSFREMDVLKGRHQTTKGIWIAKAVAIEPFTVVLDLERFTVVLDLEGTDGRERGQVTSKKAAIINHYSEMKEKLGSEALISIEKGEVISTHYKLFSADICDIPKLDSVIRMAEMDPSSATTAAGADGQQQVLLCEDEAASARETFLVSA